MKITMFLPALALAFGACGPSPETEAARAEARLEELERELEELGTDEDADWQDAAKLLEEAKELASTPALVAKQEAEFALQTARAEAEAEERRQRWERERAEQERQWAEQEREREARRAEQERQWAEQEREREARQAEQERYRREEERRTVSKLRTQLPDAAAETERLHRELIDLHRAVQAAHVDEWEARWAGDRATLAEDDLERFLADDLHRLLQSEHLADLERAAGFLASWTDDLEDDVADVGAQLKALQAARTP